MRKGGTAEDIWTSQVSLHVLRLLCISECVEREGVSCQGRKPPDC